MRLKKSFSAKSAPFAFRGDFAFRTVLLFAARAAALAVFEAIEKEKLLANAVIAGSQLFKKLNDLKRKHPVIRQVRGMALMAGVELEVDGKEIYEECLKRKLLINCTQGNVLRLMPPLIVKEREIDRAIQILEGVLIQQEKKGLAAPQGEARR